MDNDSCQVLVLEKLVEQLELSVKKPIFLMPSLKEDVACEIFVPRILVEWLKRCASVIS